MRGDMFIERFQRRTGIHDPDRARLAVRSTLETLGETLSPVERGKLAAELPRELAGWINHQMVQQPWGLEEFLQRVGARGHLAYLEAERQAAAVVAVLGEAISAAQLKRVADQLPTEYDQLFSGDPGGAAPPLRAAGSPTS